MTYDQWVMIEGLARCSRFQAHGIHIYPLSEEQRSVLAEYEAVKAERGWRRLLRKYVAYSIFATMEQVRQFQQAVRYAPR